MPKPSDGRGSPASRHRAAARANENGASPERAEGSGEWRRKVFRVGRGQQSQSMNVPVVQYDVSAAGEGSTNSALAERRGVENGDKVDGGTSLPSGGPGPTRRLRRRSSSSTSITVGNVGDIAVDPDLLSPRSPRNREDHFRYGRAAEDNPSPPNYPAPALGPYPREKGVRTYPEAASPRSARRKLGSSRNTTRNRQRVERRARSMSPFVGNQRRVGDASLLMAQVASLGLVTASSEDSLPVLATNPVLADDEVLSCYVLPLALHLLFSLAFTQSLARAVQPHIL